MMRSPVDPGRAQWDEPEVSAPRRRSRCRACKEPARAGNSHCDDCAAKKELRETLAAWQRGQDEIDQSLAEMAPNGSRRRLQLYEAQRSLIETLSPAAKALFAKAPVVIVGGRAYWCRDPEGQVVDNCSVLVLGS